ncbi:hypothetical protein SEA_MCGALLEON_33 [Microbacterium phage McGalleon]|uniref:Uncharacterized protein n=1 Tax=Microbacterium phage McGalleon TaxID=2590936 RepID=A0A516KR07_9CAUD|nr:hypothetical protein H3N88_gp33 [Microbacterium phage McGalleon]QDP44085.1 hypothetical protein SEA_MCGALLEON_33 [Microbacterium phage McGalleon]
MRILRSSAKLTFMNNTAPHKRIDTLEFEGFFYVTNGEVFAKGCRRCGGTGHYSFNGFDSICYLCNNVYELRLGDIFDNEAAAQKWCHERAVRKAQADRKREAERLAKIAKRDAAWQALKDAHPAVWDMLAGVLGGLVIPFEDNQQLPDVVERDNFVRSLADRLWSLDERPFTARQLEVLQEKAEKRATRKAEAAETPAPEGRVVVTGEIVGTKVVEGDYGTAYKVTVKDDRGFRVYVSLPKAQADEAFDKFYAEHEEAWNNGQVGYAVWFMGSDNEPERYKGLKGRRITFTAALERSRDDESFAFGKRPTKGAWL